ncbi:MAG: FoF1 ATP synthase subunit gamma, partial [Eubacteriales bacterium]|nr:FoF1 ATP synthase subunit gamma [Eubacteriales bacterium]
AQKLYEEHPETKFYVVGEYGRQFFRQNHIPIERSFLYTAQNPTMDRAREISSILLEGYSKGELGKIFIIYTDMRNSLKEEAVLERLLPFHRQQFADTAEKEKPVQGAFEFLPSVETILNAIMPSYISGFIYSALVDSFCCEQNARMMAMSAANQNADSILSDLSIQYNRIRQSVITQEITEVSSGAKSQRRKHNAEA